MELGLDHPSREAEEDPLREQPPALLFARERDLERFGVLSGFSARCKLVANRRGMAGARC